jgi:hypothetical protein
LFTASLAGARQAHANAPPPDLNFTRDFAAEEQLSKIQEACVTTPGATRMSIVKCEMAAGRDYDKATHNADADLEDALSDAVDAIARDADSGVLTTAEADAAQAAVTARFQARLDQAEAESARRAFNAGMAERFDQEYAKAKAKRGPFPDGPAYRQSVQPAAWETRRKAALACTDPAQSNLTYQGVVDCLLAEERAYAETIALRDMAALDAVVAVFQTVPIDAPGAEQLISAWFVVMPRYDAMIKQEQADYTARQAAPKPAKP